MSVTDFLFEGQPPTSVTTYGKTVSSIPNWMSDYTQGLIAKANAVAAEPYQGYQGPRIAGFAPSTEQAFDLTRANVGAWSPYAEAATGLVGRAGEVSPLEAASPLIAAGAQTFPGAAQEYMDPYIQNVLERNQQMAQRTLEEKFLPSLQASFAGAGQFGSERMMRSGERGLRDITEGLSAQNQAALSQAYQQAGTQFQSDAARQAQLAATTGQLQQAGAGIDLEAAKQMGALGEFTTAQGLRDAAALEAVGQREEDLAQRSMDLAYGDFAAQRDYPRQTLDWMSNIVRGLPAGTQQTTATTGPASVYGPSPLAQVASGLSTAYGLQQMNRKRGGHIKGALNYA